MKAMVACSALLSALVAAAAPVLAAGSPNTPTERFHCYRIRTGDSAADVAQHLTGHRGNLSGALFQVFDSRRQLVPKTQSDRIAAGWTVCLAEGRAPAAIPAATPAMAAVSVQQSPVIDDLQPIFYDPDVWWLASLVL